MKMILMSSRIATIVAVVTCAAAANAAGEDPSRPLSQRQGATDARTVRFFANPVSVPPFSAPTLDGQTIRSDQWRGKVTLVNFWATWCGPCRAEIPDLLGLQAKYPDRLRLIGISADEGDVGPVKHFVAALRMNFPIVMLTPKLDQLLGGVQGLPTTLLVDREGRVVKRHLGAIDSKTIELEVRVLAGLEPDVTIERIAASPPN